MNGRAAKFPGQGPRIAGLALGAIILSVGLLSESRAQDSNLGPILDRMERLERDIRTLNLSISRGTPLPPASQGDAGAAGGLSKPAIARLGLRMDRLEQDIRDATGTMEELNFRINQVVERLDKLVGDVDFRLSALEEKLSGGGQPRALGQGPGFGGPSISAAPSPAGVQAIAPGPQSLGTVSVSAIEAVQAQKLQTGSPQAPAPAQQAAVSPPPGPLPAGTPKEQYAYAFNLLRQTNYDQAEMALKAFIETHADDPLTSNARYWLGETHYVRGAYQEAAQVFFEGFQKDPKGPKAADTLLKLGMSLAGLNKQPEACAAFTKVLADFPRASAGVKSAVSRERQRNGCP